MLLIRATQIRNEKKNFREGEKDFAYFLIVALLLCKAGFSAELDIRPALAVSQVAIQDETGSRELSRDLITELIPSLNVDIATRRINAQAEYAYEQRAYYRNSDHLQASQQYRLASSLEFLKNRGIISVASSSGQRLTDPLGGLSINNNAITGNRSNYQSYTAGVKWDQPISSFSNGSIDVSINKTVSDSDFINNTQNQFARAVLSSGKWFQRSYWSIETIRSRQAYSANQSPYIASALVNAGFRITKQIDISSVVGYEWNPQSAFSQSRVTSGYVAEAKLNWLLNKQLMLNTLYGRRSYGETYNLDVNWNPFVRTELNGSYGKEVFGKTYSFLFSHHFRKASWTLSYAEKLTSRSYVEIEQELALLLDQDGLPIVSSTTGQPLIAINNLFFIRDGVYVEKMLSIGSDIKGRRSVLSTSLSYQKRVFQEDEIKDQAYSASISWTLHASASGALSALASVHRGGYGDSVRKDDVYQGQLSYSHQLAKAISARIEYTHLMRDSSEPESDQKQGLVRAQISAEW